MNQSEVFSIIVNTSNQTQQTCTHKMNMGNEWHLCTEDETENIGWHWNANDEHNQR